jgi:hypothetical protein
MFMKQFKGKSGASPKASDAQSRDWLLTGILSELKRRGLIADSRAVDPARISASYGEASALIRAHLEKRLREDYPQVKYVELLALGQIVGRALFDHMAWTGNVGIRMLLNNVDKSLEALDESFPGYLQAGSLGLLLGSKTKTKISMDGL